MTKQAIAYLRALDEFDRVENLAAILGGNISKEAKAEVGEAGAAIKAALEDFKRAAFSAFETLKQDERMDRLESGNYYSLVELFGHDLEDCDWTAHEVAALVHLL